MRQGTSKWQGFLFLLAILILGWALKAVKQQLHAADTTAMVNKPAARTAEPLPAAKKAEKADSARLHRRPDAADLPQSSIYLLNQKGAPHFSATRHDLIEQ